MIYLSLLCPRPKCLSHESKLVLGTIQFCIYCFLTFIFTKFKCWLKLLVETSPSSGNTHCSFYFLGHYPEARRLRTTIKFLYFQNCLVFATFFHWSAYIFPGIFAVGHHLLNPISPFNITIIGTSPSLQGCCFSRNLSTLLYKYFPNFVSLYKQFKRSNFVFLFKWRCVVPPCKVIISQ